MRRSRRLPLGQQTAKASTSPVAKPGGGGDASGGAKSTPPSRLVAIRQELPDTCTAGR